MQIFLNSFEPLVKFRECREAIKEYKIPPFVDRSCRREPDFESQYPLITGLCRGDKFTKRLHCGDIAIYRTKKGEYDAPFRHWRIVAMLKVLQVLPNHETAAAWYQNRNLQLPNNCMVAETAPFPKTHTMPLSKTKNRFTSIYAWNAHYKRRSIDHPCVAVCAPLYVELFRPPIWTDEMELETFGRKVGTRNPPQIKLSEYRRILQLTGIKPDKPNVT